MEDAFSTELDNLRQTCSANFRDKLLVETDIFYHFRGITLCNTKLPLFKRNKKQEHKVTVQ